MKLLFSYFSLMLYLDSIVIIETRRTKSAVQKLVDLEFPDKYVYGFVIITYLGFNNNFDECWEGKKEKVGKAPVRYFFFRIAEAGTLFITEENDYYLDVRLTNLRPAFMWYKPNMAVSDLGSIQEPVVPLYKILKKEIFFDNVYRIFNLLVKLLQQLNSAGFKLEKGLEKFDFAIKTKENEETIIFINLAKLSKPKEEADNSVLIEANKSNFMYVIRFITIWGNCATVKKPWYAKFFFFKTREYKYTEASARAMFRHQITEFEERIKNVDLAFDYNELHQIIQPPVDSVNDDNGE